MGYSAVSGLLSLAAIYYFARYLVSVVPGLAGFALPSPFDVVVGYWNEAAKFISQYATFDGFVYFLGYLSVVGLVLYLGTLPR